MTQWGLDNLFNPGKRHMDDEKRRLQSTREEVGDNSGGRRIDFDGGKVSISVPRRAAEAASTEAAPSDADDDVAPAVEAVDLPAVALGSDETEIEPEVVEEPAEVAAPEPAAEDRPAVSPDEEPATVAPKRVMSANAWARRG